MLKHYLLAFICLFCLFAVSAQDGSDMLYIPPDSLHKYFARTIQVDFDRLSRRGRSLDTVSLSFKGSPIRFLEHRSDNGYNNWFYSQYLESLDDIGGWHLRLVKTKVTSISRDEIGVVNVFNFYNENGVPLLPVPIEDKSSYRKKSIAEILVLVE
ncbi:MAG: hypothetical protein EOO01_27430 [Chitinophagaceae bacterium]|nr:MAG: hypothetical protein EOO01_27430 [Chitinophagaceae bacterium]